MMGDINDQSNKAQKVSPTETKPILRRVMNAVLELQGTDGVKLIDLQKFFSKQDDPIPDEDVKVALREWMDLGILEEEGGNYKVIERRRTRSRRRSKKRSKKTSAKKPKRKSIKRRSKKKSKNLAIAAKPEK